MEEPCRRAVRREADDEDGVRVVEREQRVERHRETALGLVAAPVDCDRFDLLPQAFRDLARP